MKKMTCRDMGGPCDTEMLADSADEMVKKGAEHVMQMQDDDHKKVLEQMNAMMGTEEGEKWNEDFKKKFEAAPEA